MFIVTFEIDAVTSHPIFVSSLRCWISLRVYRNVDPFTIILPKPFISFVYRVWYRGVHIA